MGCGSTNNTHVETAANDDDQDMSWTEPSSCSGSTTYSTSWTTELATSGQNLGNGANYINDYKFVYLKSFFSDKPESLIQDCYHGSGCMGGDPYCQETAPSMVEYYIRHPSFEDKGNYTFYNVSPLDGSGDNADIIGTILDVASAVGSVSSPWVGAVGAAIKSFISSGSGSVSANDDPNTLSGDSTRQYMSWDIEMSGGGSEDHPDGPCESSGVEFKLDNNLEDSSSDDSFKLDSWVRHTFFYHKLADGRCESSYCEEPNYAAYEKTENWVMNTSEWQNVE